MQARLRPQKRAAPAAGSPAAFHVPAITVQRGRAAVCAAAAKGAAKASTKAESVAPVLDPPATKTISMRRAAMEQDQASDGPSSSSSAGAGTQRAKAGTTRTSTTPTVGAGAGKRLSPAQLAQLEDQVLDSLKSAKGE